MLLVANKLDGEDIQIEEVRHLIKNEAWRENDSSLLDGER